MPRTLKQILYGIFFLIILGSLGTGSYFLFFKSEPSCFDNIQNQKEEGIDCGGGCIPCELKSLKIIAEEPKVFPAGNLSTFIIKVTNPSSNYGTRGFDYSLEIIGQFGAPLRSLTRKTTLASGESKYLVIAGVDVSPKDVSTVKFNVLSYNWESRETLPVYDLKTDKVVVDIFSSTPSVSGKLINNSSLSFTTIRISVVLFDRSGTPVNASQTEIDNIQAFSTTSFTAFFPRLDSMSRLDITKTQVFAEPIND